MSDAFDSLLPLPYRIISLVVAGCWFWLITLKIAYDSGLNTIALLKLDQHPNYYANHQKNCVKVSLISALSYVVHLTLHNNTVESLTIFDFIPFFTLVIIFYLLLKPNNIGSKRLGSTFKRILVGNIDQEIRTNDILLSDTLTSYSKVLIDLSIYLCHIFSAETCLPKEKGSTINRQCGDSIFLDSIIGSYPTFIRLKQCWFEYSASNHRNKSHLLNFIKYSTNIPILVISIILKLDPEKKNGVLPKYWTLAALLNSTYSFIWDVNNDWDLQLFRKLINGNADVFLRSQLLYQSVKVSYPLAIILDLQFRFIWIYKLLPAVETPSFIYSFLSNLYKTESGLYYLQIIELLRRWIWIFIKIEADYISSTITERKVDIELNALNE